MSFKAIFIVVILLLLGVFMYVKYEAMGSPNSSFNQTTRFVLGRRPIARTIFGLHNKGDARAEYLEGTGPLVVEWFEPVSETVDNSVVQKFADLAGKYLGRQDMVISGGSVSEGTDALTGLGNLSLKGAPPSGSTILYVVFTTDYQPRAGTELATTLGETTEVISLNANRQFLTNYGGDLDNYLFSDLLREFGQQIGLSSQSTGLSCIMNSETGYYGQPFEASGLSDPQDFCPAEQQEIQQLKLQY